jgi:recombinational DNA repair ATPase RecF
MESRMEPLHIVELRSENFARLRAVAIRPDGPVVQITGRNAQGKTSVLNSIWTCLKGRAVAPPQPIRG